MSKKTIKDVQLKGKKVLMRVDFNVPMKNGVITDTNRIVQALPTIKYALEQGAKLVVFSHLGRVKDEADLAKNDLAPVARKLEEMLGQPVPFINATRGEALEQAIDELDPKALRTEGYNAYYYIPDILVAIGEIKKNLMTKDEFFKNLEKHPDWGMGLEALKIKVAEKLKKGSTRTKTLEGDIEALSAKIEKSKEIWALYERYCELMRENNLIDFSDTSI